MARGLAFLLLWAALFLSGQERKRAPLAELEMADFTAQRSVSRVHLDGTVRNTGASAIEKPLIVFYFVSPDKKVVATRSAPVEVKRLEPGEDARLMLETGYPARASEIRLEAFDGNERYIKLTNAGPYPIE
jgi:hypothetical protein